MHNILFLIFFLFCLTTANAWQLDNESSIEDHNLTDQIFRALDAASKAQTNPILSNYQVRSATIIEHEGKEHVFISGNTEYLHPDGIHSETALVSQVIAQFGPAVVKEKLRFIAFYMDNGSTLSPCGDCRDYLIANTDKDTLLEVVGDNSTKNVIVRPFKDSLVCEEQFTRVASNELPVANIEQIVNAAAASRDRGIRNLNPSARHTAAAAVSASGKIYRAVGMEDGAFHYRNPIGSVLQQAASEGDFHIEAIVVVGEEGNWPVVSYRERQYGNEFSWYNEKSGHPPILLILTDRLGNYRCTSFGECLPNAFRFEPSAS